MSKVESQGSGDWPSPVHLDTVTRNRRLYDWLLSLGLYVEPVPKYVEGVGNMIDHLIVAAGSPQVRGTRDMCRPYHDSPPTEAAEG